MNEDDLLKIVFLGHIPENQDPVEVAQILLGRQQLSSSVLTLILETFVQRACQQPTPMDAAAHYRRNHRKLYKLLPARKPMSPQNRPETDRDKMMEIACNNKTITSFCQRFSREIIQLMDIAPED